MGLCEYNNNLFLSVCISKIFQIKPTNIEAGKRGPKRANKPA